MSSQVVTRRKEILWILGVRVAGETSMSKQANSNEEAKKCPSTCRANKNAKELDTYPNLTHAETEEKS